MQRRIKTTFIHGCTSVRMDAMLKTMIRKGHIITDSNPDLWFIDCIWPRRIEKSIIDEALSFSGDVVLISLGDFSLFNLDGLPEEFINKVSGFAKIQWSDNDSEYDPRVLSKNMIFHPFLLPEIPKPIKLKRKMASFLGFPTGEEDSEENLRIRACKKLKKHDWFLGGIVGQEPGAPERDIAGIGSRRLSRQTYLSMMNQCLLSLCMPGNSILTYRLFESLGLMCGVISTDLNRIHWLNKLEPGRHYLKVQDDLSDLEEVCDRALQDRIGTQRIAEHGYLAYQEYYQIMPDGGLTESMWELIKQQMDYLGVAV